MAGSNLARGKNKITVRNQGGGEKKGGAHPSATGFLNAVQSRQAESAQKRDFVFVFKSPFKRLIR